MKLYLVRHGQTDWNKEKRLQGQEDIPLNDFGRHLAKETGIGLRNVRFDLCFSSDLKRALETANLILDEGSSKVPIIMDKRLEQERESGLSMIMDELPNLSEPTYRFNIGDKVAFGGMSESTVEEVLFDGKVYGLRCLFKNKKFFVNLIYLLSIHLMS